MSSNTQYPGTLHKYFANLVAFEHGTASGSPHSKLVIFVGGLSDGITTVPYVRDLALELDKHGWGLAEILTTSSFGGWGTGDLTRDAHEITQAVKYFKSAVGGARAKVVVQGHSTGTQDTMYYLTQQYPDDSNDLSKRPLLDGAILQACASDREAYIVINGKKDYTERLAVAEQWIEAGRGKDVLPSDFGKAFFDSPGINAQRWVSLMAVRGGDDYFSSDLAAADHAKTFGKVNTKLLVVYSGNDEFVPVAVDKPALLAQWKAATDPAVWSHYSGIVDGATHNLNDKSDSGARPNLILRISKFLADL